MKISIFGLGYVGSVSLGCFARSGHNVIGVDINKKKVELIKKGYSTIIEPGLSKLISTGSNKKKITATNDYRYAIKNSDISFICIGTPGKKDGNLNLKYLFNSLKQIADGMVYKGGFHTVVVRSTVHPGSHKIIIEELENHSGKKAGRDFCVIINPEFLREGSAVKDFFNPPFNIIGSNCSKGIVLLKKLYKINKAPTYVVKEETAEMIKLVSNSFHSLKITFANEIGNILKRMNIDSNELMDLIVKDNKLNVSRAYMKPGFAFGGSCLPKDIKALNKIAKENSVKIPLLSNVINSNELQKNNAYNLVTKFRKKNIGIWGLSFKAGTDDMRGSPVLDLADRLLKNNYNVRMYDQNVNLEKIIGANKEYLYRKLPGISRHYEKDFKKLLKYCDVLIINSNEGKLINILIKHKNIIIVDLMNIKDIMNHPKYYGLSW